MASLTHGHLKEQDVIRNPIGKERNLFAESSLKKTNEKDGEDAKEEGEDGGEEEAPPLPLLQALLIAEDGNSLGGLCFHPALLPLDFATWRK